MGALEILSLAYPMTSWPLLRANTSFYRASAQDTFFSWHICCSAILKFNLYRQLVFFFFNVTQRIA